MNLKLNHSSSYCDSRIMFYGAAEFVDNSWHNNATGSIYAIINNKEVEIFCPNNESNEGDSHDSFNYYSICINDEFVEGTFDVEGVLKFLKEEV